MRKKARPRNPEEPVVATFMIAYEKWQAFKTVIEAEGTTVSTTLVAFIEGYLDATRSPHLSSQEINTRLQNLLSHKTAYWEQQMTTLQHRVLKTEASVENLDFLIENLQREKAARLVELDESLTEPELEPNPVSESEAIAIEAAITLELDETPTTDSPTPESPESEPFPPYEAPQPPDGLTQMGLCRAFGLRPDNLARLANQRGTTLEHYLYLLTGWSYRQGRYYPPR